MQTSWFLVLLLQIACLYLQHRAALIFLERHGKLSSAHQELVLHKNEGKVLHYSDLAVLIAKCWHEEGCTKEGIKNHHTALVFFSTDWLLIFPISVHLTEMRDGTAKPLSVTMDDLTGVICLVWVIVCLLTRPAFKGRENKRSKLPKFICLYYPILLGTN